MSNATPLFNEGDLVVLHSLSARPNLNNRTATVLIKPSVESERYAVQVNETGETIKVKPSNMKRACATRLREEPILFVSGGQFFQPAAAMTPINATLLDAGGGALCGVHQAVLPSVHGCDWEVRLIEQDAAMGSVTVTLMATKDETATNPTPLDAAAWDELRGQKLTRTIRVADGEDAASHHVSARVERGVLIVQVPAVATVSVGEREKESVEKVGEDDKENVENVFFNAHVDESVAFGFMQDLQRGAAALAKDERREASQDSSPADGDDCESGGKSGGESGDEDLDVDEGIEPARSRRKRERRQRGGRGSPGPALLCEAARGARRRCAAGRSRLDPAWMKAARAARMAEV